MSLACLGYFVFELRSIPFTSWQEDSAYRHPSNSVVGEAPRSQFTGPEQDTISLSAALYPEVSGGQESINALKEMAAAGQSYPLITGEGEHLGAFVIENIGVNKSAFLQDGYAQKLEFTLKLKRTGDKPDDSSPELDALNSDLINGFFA